MADAAPPKRRPRKSFPGSRFRAGAMSEWARTRSGAIAQRAPISRASAIVASIWRSGKGGEPPSWPGLTISIPIEAEFRSLSPFHDASARVPGAVSLRDQLVDRAVFPNQIMRGHFTGGIGKRLQRGLAGRHARIVQDEAIRPAMAAPLAMVGRGDKAGDERAVRDRAWSCPASRRPRARVDRAMATIAMAHEAWIDQYQARQTRWP